MQESDLYTCSVIPYLIKNMMNMREYENLNCAYRLRYIAKRVYAHYPSILSGTFIESLRASGKLEWISNLFEPRIK